MKRRNIVIVALIAIGFILAGGVPMLMALYTESQVEGVTYYSHGIAGGSVAGGAPNDMLDAESYVTSWAGGLSEKIVIRPYWKFYADRPVVCSIEETWVKVKLTGVGSTVLINGVAGTEWQSARYGVGGGTIPDEQWQPLPSIIIELKNPFTGGISVELWAFHKWDVLLNSGDDMIASDKANLLPGIGSVYAQDDIVEEGETARFTVRTGYSESTKEVNPTPSEGWAFGVYSLRTGTKVYSTTLADDYYGTVSWLVPDGTFVTVGDNTHRAVLTNTLFDIDFVDTFVIGAGMRDQIPQLPTFEIVAGDAPYIPGETVSVQVTAKSNTITNSPIDGFWINVYYELEGGASSTFIYNHKWYIATATSDGGTCVVTFTMPESGKVVFEASAQDDNNLNSGISRLNWIVYADGDGGGDEPPLEIDWASLVIAAMLLVGAVLVYTKAPLQMYIKLLLTLGMLAGAGYFMLQAFGV